MASSFVPWSESLRAEVLAAFGPPMHWTIEQGRSGWREPTDTERWSRAVVLVRAGRPVAVASAFHPELHPTREWCFVEVAPDQLGHGYGDAALSELRRTLPSDAGPLRAKVRTGSAGERFARRHGLQPIQRTREVRVTVPDALPASALFRAVVVPKEQPIAEATATAWCRYYTAGHDWDPPVNLSVGRCRELFLTPAECVLVATRGDDVAGIAIFETVDARATFVGGAVDRHDPEAVEIAAGLLVSAADLTADRCLDVELDDWMWEVARAIEPWAHEVVDEAYIVAEPPAPAGPI